MATTTLTLTEAARKAAVQTRVGGKITGETIRTRVQESSKKFKNVTPAAWGGVIQGLVRSGVLAPTGETVKMTSPQARGRRSPVYTRQSVRA